MNSEPRTRAQFPSLVEFRYIDSPCEDPVDRALLSRPAKSVAASTVAHPAAAPTKHGIGFFVSAASQTRNRRASGGAHFVCKIRTSLGIQGFRWSGRSLQAPN